MLMVIERRLQNLKIKLFLGIISRQNLTNGSATNLYLQMYLSFPIRAAGAVLEKRHG